VKSLSTSLALSRKFGFRSRIDHGV
jgi:hypothetical protein